MKISLKLLRFKTLRILPILSEYHIKFTYFLCMRIKSPLSHRLYLSMNRRLINFIEYNGELYCPIPLLY